MNYDELLEQAEAYHARLVEQTIDVIRKNAHLTIKPLNICLNCGEKLKRFGSIPPPPRWCDADCRDDWQKRQHYEF